MYFFDFNDYINSAQERYTYWHNDTILMGYFGLCGWRGFTGGDPEDTFTTARATYLAWFKGLIEYFEASLDILNEPSDSTINNLYYNEFWDAHENFIVKQEIYFNSYKAIKRYYDYSIFYGPFTGTYNQWLQTKIDIFPQVVVTGTTTDYYTRPMVSGGTVSTPIVINYGGFNDVQYKDEYYNEFKESMNELMRIMKTAMVLIDGDTFPDLESETIPLNTNCEVKYPPPPMYLDTRLLDFMDNLTIMPTGNEIETLNYSNNSCDYTSSTTMFPGVDKEDFRVEYRDYRDNLFDQLDDVIDGMYLGFNKYDFPKIDYSFNPTTSVTSDAFYKGNMRRVKHTWWSKASAYTEWNSVSYPTHGTPLSTLLSGVGDFKYLSARPNTSSLPSTATKGDLICVGTPTSYVGYAWDPILNSWSTNLYNFIDAQILTQRRVQKNNAMAAKRNVMLSIKPMLWANEYIISDVVRNWQLSDVSGYTVQRLTEIIASNGASLPPKYTITASTHTSLGFNATTIIY
jgi:hypothetical protein